MNAEGWGAAQVLGHLGIAVPPIDVVRVAHMLGADVRFVRGADWDGALESSEGGEARIYVDTSSSPTEQRFTIAHELGHLLCHRPGLVFRDRLSVQSSDRRELQANEFAADLLMPRAMLEPLIAHGRTRIDGLADVFQVSPHAMERRLKTLGYRLR